MTSCFYFDVKLFMIDGDFYIGNMWYQWSYQVFIVTRVLISPSKQETLG